MRRAVQAFFNQNASGQKRELRCCQDCGLENPGRVRLAENCWVADTEGYI